MEMKTSSTAFHISQGMETKLQTIDRENRQIDPAAIFRQAIDWGISPEDAALLADIAMLYAKGLRGRQLQYALEQLYEEA